MNRWLEGVRGVVLAAIALSASLAQPASAKRRDPPDPRADAVGQVIGESRSATLPVAIIRNGKTNEKIRNYALLFPGDRLYVTDKAARVEVQIYGGDSTSLDGRVHGGRSNPYEVAAAPHRPGWDPKGLAALLLQFPKLFEMPANRPALLTTPNGPKGAEAGTLSPTKLLPASPQTLKVGQGKVLVPVTWIGGPAMVRLARECRLSVVEEISPLAGFVTLHPSNLVDDTYCIDIWPVDGTGAPNRKAGFSIPVTVSVEEPPAADEQAAVLAAAAELRGPAAGRLQGLVDIQRQAQTSFKAWLILRNISAGEETAPENAKTSDAKPSEVKADPPPQAKSRRHKHRKRR